MNQFRESRFERFKRRGGTIIYDIGFALIWLNLFGGILLGILADLSVVVTIVMILVGIFESILICAIGGVMDLLADIRDNTEDL